MKYPQLLKAIDSASQQLTGRVATVANQALVLRNWLVGAYLVDYEQAGADRAQYGARLLERLAADLASRGLKGLDNRSLRDCRLLFQTYPQIRGTLSPELHLLGITPNVRRRSIRGTVSPELPAPLSAQIVLQFSWSKLQEFIRLDDPLKRAFYENECLKGNWSVRQLQPTNLTLRLRALFGINVRCEIVLYLLTHEAAHPAEIAQEAGFFERAVQSTLVDMSEPGVVGLRTRGREKR